eukprot:scaffold4439_cov163-Isochrysis_galbana.AAC.3
MTLRPRAPPTGGRDASEGKPRCDRRPFGHDIRTSASARPCTEIVAVDMPLCATYMDDGQLSCDVIYSRAQCSMTCRMVP